MAVGIKRTDGKGHLVLLQVSADNARLLAIAIHLAADQVPAFVLPQFFRCNDQRLPVT